jgi:hypothetical protein
MPTPPRAVELKVLDGGHRLDERWLEGAPCRLTGVLLRDPPAASGAGAPRVIGAAWVDDAGEHHWGWPSDDGATLLRPAPGGDWRGCLLPPAVSLALCMRRRGTDLGLRAAILGAGLAASLATAVAETLGCRVTRQDGGASSAAGSSWSAPIVVEASGARAGLETALARCEDWGVVYSMAGGLSSSALDYYTDVHRRALTVCRVPDVPGAASGGGELVERGAAVLLPALGRVVADLTGDRERASVQPGDRPAQLVRDGSGLCLVTVAGR